jgi:hypothetical protein
MNVCPWEHINEVNEAMSSIRILWQHSHHYGHGSVPILELYDQHQYQQKKEEMQYYPEPQENQHWESRHSALETEQCQCW